jgi:AcrR family transcriptional regulator
MADSEPTPRQRLLDVAVESFAEKGFAAVSVRDICGQAGVNVAAVNYYFGDKERLYIEAVKYAHACMLSQVPIPDNLAALPALQQLRTFIDVTVARIFREPNPYAAQLVMRELAHPSAACGEMVRATVRPMADLLQGILRRLMPDSTERDRYLVGFSVVAQCLFYKQTRAVARELMGPEGFDRLTAAEIAGHVYAFTLRGLQSRGVDVNREGGR